jgi:hypothetical protein
MCGRAAILICLVQSLMWIVRYVASLHLSYTAFEQRSKRLEANTYLTATVRRNLVLTQSTPARRSPAAKLI